MTTTSLLLGCDPEMFLRSNSSLISAIGLIGGSKDEPKPIDDKGHAIQEDNVAVEFCIPPAADVLQWNNSIEFVMGHISEMIKPQGLTLDISASHVFPEDQLDNPKAREFGCDPDFNAYTRTQNPRPHAEDPNLRSAGGHIHFGHEILKDFDNAMNQIKLADLFLGIPSVLMDGDTRRRELYGKSGCCRIKPYGVEYRTLSNFWLKSKELREWAFKQAQAAFESLKVGHAILDDARFQQLIERTINQGDKKSAEKFVKMFGLEVI